MSFQPRPGDVCTWVEETAFYDFDDELEEETYTMAELKEGYAVLANAFKRASIPFAAIGGLAMAILGGREGTLTHDIDFQFNGTVVKLFDTLRATSGIRLKKGLQADNFRVHCQIKSGRWVGVDMLVTNNPVGQTSERSGVLMLEITPLLQSKLKSFTQRDAARDANDIVYLVEKYAQSIDKSKLDRDQVNHFLTTAPISKEANAKAKKVLIG